MEHPLPGRDLRVPLEGHPLHSTPSPPTPRSQDSGTQARPHIEIRKGGGVTAPTWGLAGFPGMGILLVLVDPSLGVSPLWRPSGPSLVHV